MAEETGCGIATKLEPITFSGRCTRLLCNWVVDELGEQRRLLEKESYQNFWFERVPITELTSSLEKAKEAKKYY